MRPAVCCKEAVDAFIIRMGRSLQSPGAWLQISATVTRGRVTIQTPSIIQQLAKAVNGPD